MYVCSFLMHKIALRIAVHMLLPRSRLCTHDWPHAVARLKTTTKTADGAQSACRLCRTVIVLSRTYQRLDTFPKKHVLEILVIP